MWYVEFFFAYIITLVSSLLGVHGRHG